MRYELRLERDGFSVDAAIRKGRSLPQWFLECPELEDDEVFYLNAFYDLNSCRDTGWSPGPIPWTAIRDYADYRGLEPHLLDFFSKVIRIVDQDYLKYIEEQRPKTKPQGAKPKGNRTKQRVLR